MASQPSKLLICRSDAIKSLTESWYRFTALQPPRDKLTDFWIWFLWCLPLQSNSNSVQLGQKIQKSRDDSMRRKSQSGTCSSPELVYLFMGYIAWDSQSLGCHVSIQPFRKLGISWHPKLLEMRDFGLILLLLLLQFGVILGRPWQHKAGYGGLGHTACESNRLRTGKWTI